ncbi:unnamed protein product [Oikopleura dioica]|uniref:Uncharacterized protein n=1 Tax=Oikopleura dioica TaxID=34765 RepID=E4YYW5_OIKDI|nr:unnamed protein product [Oikopleura dioica]
MAFTHENIVFLNMFEDDFQPFIATEDQLAPGEENYDIKEEFFADEAENQEEPSSCVGIEFNDYEVIEPEMPPLATSSPRKGSKPCSLASPDSSSILASSFLEFETAASPSTYVSSNFSFSSPPSPFTSPTSGEFESRKRKAEEDFCNAKKVKRSLFSEESTDF